MGYTIDVKRIFLGFAQALFAENYVLTWSLDPKATKIIIGDKNFINSPLIESKPSIILTRNQLRWGHHSIDQRATYDLGTGSKGYSDLIYGTVVYNVLAKSEYVAERLADYLFTKLSGYRDQFRKNGVNKIIGIHMGEAMLLKNPTDVELTNVPITVEYALQKEWDYTVDTFLNISITTSLISAATADDVDLGTGTTGAFGTGYLIQGTDFTISGSNITFIQPLSGIEVSLSYVGGTTYITYTDTFEIPITSSLESYSLQEPVYPIYPLLSGIIVYEVYE